MPLSELSQHRDKQQIDFAQLYLVPIGATIKPVARSVNVNQCQMSDRRLYVGRM
jgi:hypothetical protein